MPTLVLSEPTNIDGNVTFICNAAPIIRNASLYWVVDGVTYNMNGTFTSSRGQLVVEQSPVDAVICRISSSLTVLNVQLNSQGVYTCSLLHNNVTLSSNRSLTLNVESSTEGSYIHYKEYYVIICYIAIIVTVQLHKYCIYLVKCYGIYTHSVKN